MMLTALATAVLTLNPPVSTTVQTSAGAKCRVIRVDTTRKGVRLEVLVPNAFPGSDAPFEHLIKRSALKAAVNGAYFDKYTLKPIGDIVIDGRLEHSGRMGTAFLIKEDGTMAIQRVIRHKTMKWDGCRLVLACGPALILNGTIDVKFQEEGFRDPHVTGRAQRMALGITADQQVLLVHIQKAVTFEEEAKVMAGLRAVSAMNLDAGASLGMAFEGKIFIKPSRKLTNVLGVFVDP